MSGQAQSDSGSEHHTFLHHEMSAEEHEKLKTLRRAAGASFIGNFIEWFDYASYGYLAAVIGIVFIPSEDLSIRNLCNVLHPASHWWSHLGRLG